MKIAIALALATASLAGPLAAKELKSVPQALDPSKAYVLVELGMVDQGRIRGQIVLARYDVAAHDVLGHGRSHPEFDNRARRTVRDFTEKGIVKEDGRRLYLLELEPDLYVIEGTNGTAFSLGSRTFRAAPGTVTDLGVVTVASDYAEGEEPDTLGVGDIAKIALLGVFAPVRVPKQKFVVQRERKAGDMLLPAALAGRAAPVMWEEENVTFGNHLGGQVNRMGGRRERVVAGAATPVAPAQVPSEIQ